MELDLTRIFVKVAQNQSFSRAAALMKLPKSTVSRAVTRLELETGTKLLVRTTRSLTLTASGRLFFEACLGPVLQLEDARKSLQGQDSILAGQVRLTAPEDLGSTVIAPAIAGLSLRHPGLRFELVYTDEVLDLVTEGFDLAVRIGPAVSSTLKLKRSGEISLIAVAAPSYLKKKEKIREPKDLKSLDCLSYQEQRGAGAGRWSLRSSEKGVAHLDIQTKISSNQMTSLLRMAVSGAGIALIPSYLCQTHLDSGALVRVLPGWSSPGFPVSILSPLSPASSARLKVTIDHLQGAIVSVLRGDVR